MNCFYLEIPLDLDKAIPSLLIKVMLHFYAGK